MNRRPLPTRGSARRNRMAFVAAVLGWTFAAVLSAQTPEATAPAKSPLATIDLGLQYVGWSSNSALPFNGYEALVPFSASVYPWSGARVYGQTQFSNASYTDSLPNTETFPLTALTDSILGMEVNFNSFSMPSLLNVAFNIPTGDPTWETKQSNSIVPTELIDSDYHGRGFGMSFLYGLSTTGKGEQYGIAAGYMYSGAFNPYTGQDTQLKLGDSVFLSLNRVGDLGGGQNDVIRVSAYYFLSTLQNNASLLQMGPNVNLSYGRNDPKAFSFEVGGQYFFPASQWVAGRMVAESSNSLGPRAYFTPSYAFGDFTLAARAKFVAQNQYPDSDPLYDGGGWLVGLLPSYLLKLDASSSLKVSAGFDFVDLLNYSSTKAGPRANVEYGHWTFGTQYEVNL